MMDALFTKRVFNIGKRDWSIWVSFVCILVLVTLVIRETDLEE